MHTPVSCPQALEEGFSWSWKFRLGRDSFVGDVVVFNSTVDARGSECLALCGAGLSVGEGGRERERSIYSDGDSGLWLTNVVCKRFAQACYTI